MQSLKIQKYYKKLWCLCPFSIILKPDSLPKASASLLNSAMVANQSLNKLPFCTTSAKPFKNQVSLLSWYQNWFPGTIHHIILEKKKKNHIYPLTQTRQVPKMTICVCVCACMRVRLAMQSIWSHEPNDIIELSNLTGRLTMIIIAVLIRFLSLPTASAIG